MPTIHLSIPDTLYKKLKKLAEEYGIQVTDLVRVLIKEGLEQGRRSTMQVDNELVNRVEALECEVSLLRELFEKLYDELKELKELVYSKKEVVEPEIINK